VWQYYQPQTVGMTPQATAAMLQKFEESVSLVNAFTDEQVRRHLFSRHFCNN
jgi:hypothetical protein